VPDEEGVEVAQLDRPAGDKIVLRDDHGCPGADAPGQAPYGYIFFIFGADEFVVGGRVGAQFVRVRPDGVEVAFLVLGQVGVEAHQVPGKRYRSRVDADRGEVGPGYGGVEAESREPARPQVQLVPPEAQLEGAREEGRDAAVGDVDVHPFRGRDEAVVEVPRASVAVEVRRGPEVGVEVERGRTGLYEEPEIEDGRRRQDGAHGLGF
jgi:hypothetical protein